MLWFERRVVDALTDAPGRQQREAVAAYVDGALRSMPEYLRVGLAAESLLLGAWPRVQQAAGRLDHAVLIAQLDRMETFPVGVVRQYVRALRSLVLFAENELVPAC